MRKLWAKQNRTVVQCENFALVRKFRTGAKIRTGANDLVMLVLRYRILYRNITSPSAQ